MLKQIKINLKFLILSVTILLFSGCVVDSVESNKEAENKNTKSYYLVVVNDTNVSSDIYMNVLPNNDIKEEPINLDLTKEKEVNSPTDLPTAYKQSLDVNRNGFISFDLHGSSSLESDSLTYEITTEPSHGSVFEWGSSYVYFPEHGYHGDDSFGFIVNDGFGDSEEAYISVKVH